jgi:uncharacterized membrane protein YdbT with pleckstrin-like domain
MEPAPGEEIFFHGHPSWRAMLAFYVRGLLLTVLAGVLAGVISRLASSAVQVGWVVVVAVIGFLATFAGGHAIRLRTTYTITSRRLTIELGILSHQTHETRLERVQNVGTRQSILQRLLRVGTVEFDTAGEAGFDFSFVGVAEPRRIVGTVDRAIGQLQAHGQQPGV